MKVLKCIHNIKIICLRYADEVSVDYEVLVQRNGRLMPAKVINISNFTMQGNICFHESLHFLVLMVVVVVVIIIIILGAYVPLTKEGNIIVNGVLASCYASVDHDLAQIEMLPMQLYPEIVQWILGKDDRVSAFVSMAKEVGRWIMPFEQFWQY